MYAYRKRLDRRPSPVYSGPPSAFQGSCDRLVTSARPHVAVHDSLRQVGIYCVQFGARGVVYVRTRGRGNHTIRFTCRLRCRQGRSMGRPRVKGALCILAGLHPDDLLSMVRTRFFTSSAVFTTVRATGLRDLLRWISGPELSMSGPRMNLIHVSPCATVGGGFCSPRAQRSVPRCTSDRRG